ncbi:hypothetical protein KAR91_53000 [Candidatus Pacearchaeota archaeon]|nr:hypothetical protein [Candidatus Pacearchaeota archaeon]
MGHTKGTWKYYKDFSAVCAVKGHNLISIADFGKSGVYETEEREANAHLIAASPELLEACKLILNCINSYNICDQINTEEAKELAETASEVYKAITKAEGR